ncbi:RNA helicase, partial [Vibrio cholerae]
MNTLVDKVNIKISSHPEFSKDKETLFNVYVGYLLGNEINLDRSFVKRIVSVIQYFGKSTEQETRREAAILLAMLLDVSGALYPELVPIAKSVFIDSGDFPNISLLEHRYPDVQMDFGFYNNARFEFKKNLNSVKELSFPLTDFQRMLWDNLESDEDVLTIAPTSAGKTHIILTYLV